ARSGRSSSKRGNRKLVLALFGGGHRGRGFLHRGQMALTIRPVSPLHRVWCLPDRLWTSAALASPAWIVNLIAPDLQAAVFCEDVRAEISGQQTLVGVFGVIPAHALPIGFFKLCLWTRWCGGAGQFVEKSLILACDD